MTDRVSELANAGRTLSAEDRVRLLDLLLESLDEESGGKPDDIWKAEIERRVAAHEKGEGELLDLDQVMDEASRIAP
jgi:putative addiction module component (TIGR02574 family)